MEKAKPVLIATIVQRMTEESERRARKLAELRETIAAGTYRIATAGIADAVARAIKG